MSDLTISKKNEVHLVVDAEPHVQQELSDYFTFDVPGAKFMPQYRNRHWDGKIRLFSTATGEVYVGLLKGIHIVAKKLGISTEVGKGYRALANISDDGGQEVPHLHFHLFGGEKVGKMVE